MFAPQDIEVFIAGQLYLTYALTRKIFEHRFGIEQEVAVAVYQNDRHGDVLRWISLHDWLLVLVCRQERWLGVSDERGELSISHDLTPMQNSVDRGRAVNVGVCGDLLGGADVAVGECEKIVCRIVHGPIEEHSWKNALEG